MSVINLLANERKAFNFEQKFVRLLDGEVIISAKNIGEFRLKKGELVEFNNLLTVVMVINPFDYPQEVEFRVTPVKIGGERNFSISSGSLDISNFPDNQAVTVTNPVESVAINNLPDNQAVTVTNPVESVAINNLPAVQVIEQKNDGGVVGLSKVIFLSPEQSIGSNLNRKDLIIRAGENNVGAVFIGSTAIDVGIPLFAGEVVILNTTAVVQVFSQGLTNEINLMEVIK